MSVEDKKLEQLGKFKQVEHDEVTALYRVGLCYDSKHDICIYKKMDSSEHGQAAVDAELKKDLALSACPYFCKVLGVPEDAPNHIILAKHSAQTLHEVLTLLAGCGKAQKPFVYVKWATQVIRALAFLHTKGYTHTELKTTTIHFDSTTDFQSANIRMMPPSTFRGRDSRLTPFPRDSHFCFIGDLRFAAPEHIVCYDKLVGDEYNTRDKTTHERMMDIYHLGLVLGQIFYARHPLPFQQCATDKEINRAMDKAPPPFLPEFAVVAKPFNKCGIIADVITKCCALDPCKRPTIDDVVKLWDLDVIAKEVGFNKKFMSL